MGRRTDAEVNPVKYVLLIHSNPTAWEGLPDDEVNRVLANHFRLIDELGASGELLRPVDGLARERVFVQNRNGSAVLTDGPFGEVKEQLAGIFAVDVEGLDRAVEIATPLAEYDVVEIRALMEDAGEEM
jgi:hypothetical protein